MTDLIGKTINGYTIKGKLGEGGQSIVYLASHEKFDEDVALRATLPKYDKDSEVAQRFQLEATIFSRLKHRYIVPILDYWSDENDIWIVQKYMVGGSLRDWINSPDQISLTKASHILETVSEALEHTHKHHIIHRDIKPDNILFDEKQTAYVHDFGVAKRLQSDPITQKDIMIGSPAYLSPEQIKVHPVTPKTDVYIMAITLFEALTKKHPYHESHGKMQILLKHLQEPLPPIQQFRPDLPETVNLVLARASAKDEEDRYPSMKAFAEAFHNVVSKET